MTPALLIGAALVAAGTIAAIWVASLRPPKTSAGVEGTPPADGAEVAAGVAASAGPDRAAPAPGAPVGRAGAPGVTPLPDPDPIDRHAEEMAAALLGQALPGDDDEVVRCLVAAIECLANAQILGPFTQGSTRWQDAARHALAELTPADLVEVLIQYLGPEASERADALRAGVEQVAGGGR